jgi:hypothetical protein
VRKTLRNPFSENHFLPLTIAAMRDVMIANQERRASGPTAIVAREVLRTARNADTAATACFNRLLTEQQVLLAEEIAELVAALGNFVGPNWWFDPHNHLRAKVGSAAEEIHEGLADADGSAFAVGFALLDTAVATIIHTTQGDFHA